MEYWRFRLCDDESVKLLNQISNRGQLKSLLYLVIIESYKIFKNFNRTLLTKWIYATYPTIGFSVKSWSR